MQTKINEYLLTLFDKKDTYVNSQQFQEDKVELVPFSDGLSELDDFIRKHNKTK